MRKSRIHNAWATFRAMPAAVQLAAALLVFTATGAVVSAFGQAERRQPGIDGAVLVIAPGQIVKCHVIFSRAALREYTELVAAQEKASCKRPSL